MILNNVYHLDIFQKIYLLVGFIYNFYAQFNIFICIQFFGYITNKKSRTKILYFPKTSNLQNY